MHEVRYGIARQRRHGLVLQLQCVTRSLLLFCKKAKLIVDAGPCFAFQLLYSIISSYSVTCFELSSDYSASGIGIPGRHPELVWS